MRFSLKPPNRVLMRQLETERFILRPAGRLELVRDPGDWRHNRHIYRHLYFEQQPMSFVRWLKLGPFPDGQRQFTFAIIPKGASTPVGYHMIRLTGWQSATNAVGVHDEAWLGKNVAVESRASLMNHFFRHADVQRFSARIAADNPASLFTYRRLGFAHVGTVHRERPSPDTGEPIDFVLFEMLKEHWMRGPYAEPGL